MLRACLLQGVEPGRLELPHSQGLRSSCFRCTKLPAALSPLLALSCEDRAIFLASKSPFSLAA